MILFCLMTSFQLAMRHHSEHMPDILSEAENAVGVPASTHY